VIDSRNPGRVVASSRDSARGTAINRRKLSAEQTFVALSRVARLDVTQFVFRSSLDASYSDAVERLVFFNHRQREAESAIAYAVNMHGTPAMVSDARGVRVVVNGRDDAQCLFALAPRDGRLDLAGMVIYVRISREEIVLLHIATAHRYSRTRRSALEVVMALVRAVRDVAHRLRGVERLSILYLRGRQFRIAIRAPESAQLVTSAS